MASVPLGLIHRDVCVAEQLVCAFPVARCDPDARRHLQGCPNRPLELERLVERFQHTLGDELWPRRQRELAGDNHELVAAEPSNCVGLADRGGQSRCDRPQQFIARGVAERVIDRLEVVEIDEQGSERCLVAAGAHHQLFDAIQDQSPVWQSGQRVVGRQKRELVLTACKLLLGALALGLEGLAHPHECDVEAALQHRQCLRQHDRPEIELRRALPHHLSGCIAPAQAALGDLVQRGCALGGELAEDLPGLLSDRARHLGALAGHPARDRDGGNGANAGEALLDHGVQLAV